GPDRLNQHARPDGVPPAGNPLHEPDRDAGAGGNHHVGREQREQRERERFHSAARIRSTLRNRTSGVREGENASNVTALARGQRLTACAAKASISSEGSAGRSEEHTSELQSPCNLVCRLLLEKKNSGPAAPASNGQ